MESKIDWSKAPEDATHYQAKTHGVFECWLKPGHSVRVSRREQDWREDGYADDLIATSAIKRPWSGEGLPPVGVVCEYMAADNLWIECEVVAHRNNAAIVIDNGYDCALVPARELRPIRTTEQIAADEREAAIAGMKMVFDSVSDNLMPTSNAYLETIFGALHDKGYRKP